MKKMIFALALLFFSLSVSAQIAGEESVTRKVLAKQGDKLVVELEIGVGKHAISRNESWAILPELSTADHQSVVLFPHVLINGRYQKHMMERRQKLSGKYWTDCKPHLVIDAAAHKNETFIYRYSVDYEEWMAKATLVLRQVLTSPGNVKRVFTVDVNGAVDVE